MAHEKLKHTAKIIGTYVAFLGTIIGFYSAYVSYQESTKSKQEALMWKEKLREEEERDREEKKYLENILVDNSKLRNLIIEMQQDLNELSSELSSLSDNPLSENQLKQGINDLNDRLNSDIEELRKGFDEEMHRIKIHQLMKNWQFREAEKVAKNWFENSPNSIEACLTLVRIYRYLRKGPRAIEFFKKAKILAPEDPRIDEELKALKKLGF